MPQIRFDWRQNRAAQLTRASRALEAGAVLVGVPGDVRDDLHTRAVELDLEIDSYEAEDGWCVHRADVDLELPPRLEES